jgi:hypothetical protein
MTVPGNPDKLNALLAQLRQAKIHHSLRDTRENAVSVDVAVPGERWEIDLLDDGSVEIEVFRSDGTIHDESKLVELLAEFAD